LDKEIYFLSHVILQIANKLELGFIFYTNFKSSFSFVVHEEKKTTC